MNGLIKIPNTRLSFPSLFQTAPFAGVDTGKYSATFILDAVEHKKEIIEIQRTVDQLIKDSLLGKALPPDKICLKVSPDDKNKFTLKCSTKKRPMVLNRDKTPLTESDNVIYAGCYVNAIVSLWAQDNQYGKRINGSLVGVMFAAHGEPFGSGGVDASEFDMFSSEDSETPF